ncbi:hypothetical protein CHS0354_021495 [Potamilus streckersoni]|uniref:Uncharacterized protein n=1 Tax=Potamilus streckersoni TaxID=2493646 RepID=A0AAE0SBA1_9BIVA|nr:hypothetical protein CHS0354_021495 [Potamilus streckersoni]
MVVLTTLTPDQDLHPRRQSESTSLVQIVKKRRWRELERTSLPNAAQECPLLYPRWRTKAWSAQRDSSSLVDTLCATTRDEFYSHSLISGSK